MTPVLPQDLKFPSRATNPKCSNALPHSYGRNPCGTILSYTHLDPQSYAIRTEDEKRQEQLLSFAISRHQTNN